MLIRDRETLRLDDLAHDPRSVGFPPGHPPMRTFLGVPIALRGVAFGNLYLTEKEGGTEFTTGDEEIVRLLAAQVAVAIENARLYESSRQWARQLESLNEFSDALAGEGDLAQLFELAASRLRELARRARRDDPAAGARTARHSRSKLRAARVPNGYAVSGSTRGARRPAGRSSGAVASESTR